MKLLLVISLLTISYSSWATVQESDILIYKSDTILIDRFPLEVLMHKDSTFAKRLRNDSCLKTSCWREHIAVWKIERDSLFLIELRDCCQYKRIPLTKVFKEREIQQGIICADWYSGQIIQGFGDFQGVDEKGLLWQFAIDISIENGRVMEISCTKPEL